MTVVSPPPLAALVEQARLAAVEQHRRLTAADIADLSRVSSATAESLGATQAAICLVDRSRLWFGGAFGFSCRETSRDSSFCNEVVRDNAPLVVPDGAVDPRFCDHDLVRGEPGLRSYAGVPLIDGGGYTVGTVAVFSTRPVSFGTAVLPELEGVARLVRDWLSERMASPRPLAIAAPAGRVQGWLGVKTVPVNKRGAGSRPAEKAGGLLVLSVAAGSPAEAAGLRPTDILEAIGEHRLSAPTDLPAAMAGRLAGSAVTVRFRRRGSWAECVAEVRPQLRPFRGR